MEYHAVSPGSSTAEAVIYCRIAGFSFRIPKKLLIHCLGAKCYKIVPKHFRIFPDHEDNHAQAKTAPLPQKDLDSLSH